MLDSTDPATQRHRHAISGHRCSNWRRSARPLRGLAIVASGFPEKVRGQTQLGIDRRAMVR